MNLRNVLLAVATSVLSIFGPVIAKAITVTVDACQSVDGGIQIQRDGGFGWTTLANECRDAGHGPRLYRLSCVSDTAYEVNWTECTPPQPPEVRVSEPEPEAVFVDHSVSVPTVVAAPEVVKVPVAEELSVIEEVLNIAALERIAGVRLADEIKTPTKTTKKIVITTVPEVLEVQKQIPKLSECGGHGHLHGEHCHCESGYMADGQMCIPLPVVEPAKYLAKNGQSYSEEYFWGAPLQLYVYQFNTSTIVHWEGARGDYDGFLVYVSSGSFNSDLSQHQPIWLSRRQYSFKYETSRAGAHTMYVFPYLRLAGGEVRRIEPGGITNWIEPEKSFSWWQRFKNLIIFS